MYYHHKELCTAQKVSVTLHHYRRAGRCQDLPWQEGPSSQMERGQQPETLTKVTGCQKDHKSKILRLLLKVVWKLGACGEDLKMWEFKLRNFETVGIYWWKLWVLLKKLPSLKVLSWKQSGQLFLCLTHTYHTLQASPTKLENFPNGRPTFPDRGRGTYPPPLSLPGTTTVM